ncbi:MAG: hypothetical protein Q8Q12_22590 [bacterium]|nr:hypothetical protein [bacterium]
MKRCPRCRKEYYDPLDLVCMECGVALAASPVMTPPAETSPRVSEDSVQRSPALSREAAQILAIVGGLIFIIGIFSPIISLPGGSTVNSLKDGRGDGIIFLPLAICALLCSAAMIRSGVVISAAVSLVGVLVDLYAAASNLAALKEKFSEEMAESPLNGLARTYAEGVQLQWGWGLLIAGPALMLIAADFFKKRRPHSAADVHRNG